MRLMAIMKRYSTHQSLIKSPDTRILNSLKLHEYSFSAIFFTAMLDWAITQIVSFLVSSIMVSTIAAMTVVFPKSNC